MPSSTRLPELAELRPAVVDHRHVHRAQDAVRHRRGPGDLQEMAAGGAGGVLGHGFPRVRQSFGISTARRGVSVSLVAIKAGCESQSSIRRRPVVWSRNGRATAAGAGTQAEGRDHRRRDVRPLQPRPLCDRRLALPDDAARRGRAAHDRGGRARACARARGGGERAAARRRHLAVRPGRQPVAGHRLLEIPHQDLRARRRRAALHGRARHRARRPQPQAQALRPLVPGRCLDRLARHHRRHDGEQFLRRALAALRHDARQRALRSTRCSPTAPRRISAR